MKNLDKILPHLPAEGVAKLEAAVQQYSRHASISFKVLTIVGVETNEPAATIRVTQERNARGKYLTADELRDRAKDLFAELLPGWTIHTRPIIYTPSPAEAVTVEWIEKQIKKHQINLKILSQELGVNYKSLSKLLNGYDGRQLTEFQKAAFYFYFECRKNK
ncbi:hypothetical protein [Roseivirga sp. UBA838]|uniref:hypothetical protein n=1 Tax=Roseivirga sp. UBA838 TaxID=1947393 RepID=UPI00257D0D7A|nr:hypothetical protein [Roseivirga sp. UBA838]|tara:strand:+ start:9120 stop:9605 length:486 start_codon:yes stop_codon:yes gene_type:complete